MFVILNFCHENQSFIKIKIEITNVILMSGMRCLGMRIQVKMTSGIHQKIIQFETELRILWSIHMIITIGNKQVCYPFKKT